MIIMSDLAGTKPKESASVITAPAPPTAAPVPSTVTQNFTSNGTVNNTVMSEASSEPPDPSEPAAASASAGASAAASASTGVSVYDSARTKKSSTVSQSFTGNHVVNNNVTVVKIAGNQSFPERNVNVTFDGKVILPDKLPLKLKPDETRKKELLDNWLFLLPFISTKSDRYPSGTLPQPSDESYNELQAVMKALHDRATKVGSEVFEKEIIEAFKTEHYHGRPPQSLDEIKQVLKSSNRDPVELAKEVAKILNFNDHFYRTTLKDELVKEGAKGCMVTKPWTFELSGPNGIKGKDSKPTILQAAVRGFSRRKAALSDVKYGGELSLSFRKPGKKKDPNKFHVPLSDEKGNHAYLVVEKMGNSQLEACGSSLQFL